MANEPVRGSNLIAGVKQAKNAQGDQVPCQIVVNENLDPPALLTDIADRTLRNLGVVTLGAGSVSIGTVTVLGSAAQGAAVSGNPVLIGVEGRDTLGTVVAAGSVVRPTADRYGRLYVVGPVVSQATSGGTPVSSATSTTAVAAPSANFHLRIHRLHASNGGSTATWIWWLDGSGGTQYFGSYLMQGATVSLKIDGGWDLTGGGTPKALVLKTSGAGSVEWNASYETVAD